MTAPIPFRLLFGDVWTGEAKASMKPTPVNAASNIANARRFAQQRKERMAAMLNLICQQPGILTRTLSVVLRISKTNTDMLLTMLAEDGLIYHVAKPGNRGYIHHPTQAGLDQWAEESQGMGVAA